MMHYTLKGLKSVAKHLCPESTFIPFQSNISHETNQIDIIDFVKKGENIEGLFTH